MSMYPAGSDNASAPWNQVEDERPMYCESCETQHPEVSGVWRGGIFYADCPTEGCGADLTYEDEPDYEAMAERQAEARADRRRGW